MGFGRPAHTRERGGILGHSCLLFSEAGARIFIGLADAITRQVHYEQVSGIEGKKESVKHPSCWRQTHAATFGFGGMAAGTRSNKGMLR